MGETSRPQTKLTGKLFELSQLVQPSEILTADDPSYIANTQPWSTGRDQNPCLVLRPANVESLSKIVRFLFDTDLDYTVRSHGYGSASARDVLISLSAFDNFEFNRREEYLLVGSGATWRQCYDHLQEVAPDWTVVGARSPSIGVGGSTLSSGFSWLSSQYGAASDPANLLDAYVVAADGKHFWASEDPDILWALRGVQSGFAIVTQFKFRARHYPQSGSLWCGPILIPRTKAVEVAEGIVSMVEKEKQGKITNKTSMFLYVLRKELLAFIGAELDMFVVHAFDERGEKAGRAEFQWALGIEGVVDQTKGNMTYRDVARLQENIGDLRGTSDMRWSPMCLTGEDEISVKIILKAFDWWFSMYNEPNSIAKHGWVFFELFSCCDNLTGKDSSAWPRPVDFKHMLLLGAGCDPNSDAELREKTKQYVMDGPKVILGKATNDATIMPNGIEDFHDVAKIYGANYSKLVDIKTRVDPEDRLKGNIHPLSREQRA